MKLFKGSLGLLSLYSPNTSYILMVYIVFRNVDIMFNHEFIIVVIIFLSLENIPLNTVLDIYSCYIQYN